MKREEAIKVLKRELEPVDPIFPEVQQALDMAIDALSVHTDTDLINREELRQRMYNETFNKDTDMQKWDSGCWIRYKLFENVLDSVPSVSAEPKCGHWVWNKDGMDWGLGAWVCSECGTKPETWWESAPNHNPLRCSGSHYCGNCGAKMKG